MSTFKIGDRVVGHKGAGTVASVGNRHNQMICVEHDVKSVYLHDGNPNITGFRGKGDCCWWYDKQDLKPVKPIFKGNN